MTGSRLIVSLGFWTLFFCWSVAGTWIVNFGHMPPSLRWSSPFYLGLCAVAGAWLLALRYGTLRGTCRAVAVGIVGLGVEMIGVHTGWPFGHYAYTNALGPQVFGVPLAIAGAWMIVTTLSNLATAGMDHTRLPGHIRAALTAACLAVCTDALLDPVAVFADHDWVWKTSGAYYGIPWSNFGGWLLVSFLLQFALMTGQSHRAHTIDKLRQTRIHILAACTYAALLLLFVVPAIRLGWWGPVCLATLPWLYALAARTPVRQPSSAKGGERT